MEQLIYRPDPGDVDLLASKTACMTAAKLSLPWVSTSFFSQRQCMQCTLLCALCFVIACSQLSTAFCETCSQHLQVADTFRVGLQSGRYFDTFATIVSSRVRPNVF